MTNTQTLVRSVLVLLAIGVAAPAAAQTTRRAPPPSSAQALRVGPLIGMEFADGETGLALRGDLSMPLSRLAPNVDLDLVLSAGLSWFSYGNSRFGNDLDVTIFKLVPALRFTVPLTPIVGIYGDAGLGLYFDSVDYGGFNDGDDDGFGATMRFAGGLFADVAPNVRLGGEIGVNPYFGDYDDTNVSLLFSAMFRL